MLQLKKINIYIVDHEIFLRPMVPMLVIEKLLIETVEKSRKKIAQHCEFVILKMSIVLLV